MQLFFPISFWYCPPGQFVQLLARWLFWFWNVPAAQFAHEPAFVVDAPCNRLPDPHVA